MSAKDFATVAGMFADDIVWHQPGDYAVSGTRRGTAEVDEVIGALFAVAVTLAPGARAARKVRNFPLKP